MSEEYIEIEFSNDYIDYTDYLTLEEVSFLSNNLKYYYDKNTTIKDLFKYITSNLINYYKKRDFFLYNIIYNNRILKFLYRIEYNKNLIYIFDLRSNVKDLMLLKNSDNKIKIVLSTFVEIGACIYNEKGIKYILHSNENSSHNLPHIHVQNQGSEVVISLLDVKVLEGGINKKKQKQAIEKITLEKESLLYKWNTMTNGQKYQIKSNELNRVF